MKAGSDLIAVIASRFEAVSPFLGERGRRVFAAAEARSLGYGGVSAVAAATGLARRTIQEGLSELAGEVELPERARRPGAGRKKKTEEDPTLLADLERLVDPVTRGDPMSPLRWTAKSLRNLAAELVAAGHEVSHTTVGRLLAGLGYSLQANAKTLEGSSHEDRNAQFEYINCKAAEHLEAGQPVCSVDTKKKELVGAYKNGGRELQPAGQPEEVQVHDFVGQLGRANPYGVYDIGTNTAWVSVGTDHDTSQFAVESIRRWWYAMGHEAYPTASRLFITADGGGSNGSRVRLWKVELQRLADETGLEISVSHFPPGTSKWNKIEHRLFSFITQNWRGKPLVSHEVIVSLIAATTTKKGLRVRADLDTNKYPPGLKVSDQEMASLNIVRDEFHGEWNYTIKPRSAT
jgi:transposase